MSLLLTITRTEPIKSGVKLKLLEDDQNPKLAIDSSSIKSIGITINLKSSPSLPPSLKPLPSTLLERYYQGKKHDVYKFPTGSRIKIMKGKFFYDTKTQEYAADPSGWWVSEKLDGIRAIWTGEHLLTRSGKLIHAPKWFIHELPTRIALDGELYLGRNQFHSVQSTVMDHRPNDYLWEKISYHVFDIPDSHKLEFEDVQLILNHHLPESKHLKVIYQSQIEDLDHLLKLQKILVSQGAEGTMLRKPHSKYRIGATYHLLKFKTNFSTDRKMVHLLDDLAIITGYKYNYQKLNDQGQPTIKSLECHWVDRKKFPFDPEFTVSHQITPSQKKGNYRKLFPIGQKIKVLYNQLFDRSQKPRFPRYGGWVLDPPL